MNMSDLPPAARLAALAEAGRAANPQIWYNPRSYVQTDFDGKILTACFLSFAALGAGYSLEDDGRPYPTGVRQIIAEFGHLSMDAEATALTVKSLAALDLNCTPFEEVVSRLREGSQTVSHLPIPLY